MVTIGSLALWGIGVLYFAFLLAKAIPDQPYISAAYQANPTIVSILMTMLVAVWPLTVIFVIIQKIRGK